MTIYPVEFAFAASAPLAFAPGEAANVFRGTLGALLHHTSQYDYKRIFAPRAFSGPSGMHDPPRPFVFRPVVHQTSHLFTLPMNLFDPDAAEPIHCAFAALDGARLRLRARLVEMRTLPPVELDLGVSPAPVSQCRVEFLTATELKAGGIVLREPDFAILLARARDRVSALCSIYQQAVPEIDFAALGERAKAVATTRSDVYEVKAWRQSRQTGETHSLGGFAGVAEYAGDLAEFLPWLQAAQWTGVGRLTPWGNGSLQVGT